MNSCDQDIDQTDHHSHNLTHETNLHEFGNQFTSNTHLKSPSLDCSDSSMLHEALNHYERYLNDYDYCRNERLKRNALEKFNLIVESIEKKSKTGIFLDNADQEEDTHQSSKKKTSNFDFKRSTSTSSSLDDTKTTHDFMRDYKSIIKRHQKRLDGTNYS